jgi:hypothetical protein
MYHMGKPMGLLHLAFVCPRMHVERASLNKSFFNARKHAICAKIPVLAMYLKVIKFHFCTHCFPKFCHACEKYNSSIQGSFKGPCDCQDSQ